MRFPEDTFLTNLLLDEDREEYRNMTPDQKRIVRFAYSFGVLTKGKVN